MSEKTEIFSNLTEADKPEYKNHTVFNELKNFINFYELFSDSVMSFATGGTQSIVNIDTYIYLSIHGTLDSIRIILKLGRLSDAFVLLRKYYDGVTLNLYTNLYLQKERSLKNDIVQDITNWLNGSERLKHDSYQKMWPFVEKSDALKDFFEILNIDDDYALIRQRCNDNSHYNYYENVLINSNQIYYSNRIKLLDLFASDLKRLFIMHLSSIFYLNDHYMASSDYLDALEVGVVPEAGSQYCVASFIQKTLSEYVKPNRPDLFKLLKEKTLMDLK